MARQLQVKNHLLLVREFVNQLNTTLIVNDRAKSTIFQIDKKDMCEYLQNEMTCEDWDSAESYLGYITKQIDNKTQEIHPLLSKILKDSEVVEENGLHLIEFKTYNDMLHFDIFNRFKEINSGFYDYEKFTLKQALNEYKASPDYTLVSFSQRKHAKLGLNKDSIILKDEKGKLLYSNPVFLDVEDFFNYYGGDTLALKSYDEVTESILDKLAQNKVYQYSAKRNNFLFIDLAKEIEARIQKEYQHFLNISEIIGQALNLSGVEFENLNSGIKNAILKHVEEREKSKVQKEEESIQERMEKLHKDSIQTKQLQKAMSIANSIKDRLIANAVRKGLPKDEILEDFNDIVKDIVYRHPGACKDEKTFEKAFRFEI